VLNQPVYYKGLFVDWMFAIFGVPRRQSNRRSGLVTLPSV